MTQSFVVDRPAMPAVAMSAEDVIPTNLQMNDVQAAFAAVNVQGVRQYYECSDPPTEPIGLLESHFKGVAAFGDKLIFTHTNLVPFQSELNGRYLIGGAITSGDQGRIDVDEYTEPPGWAHPCGIQACGSFMAMGIQRSADGDGARASEIRIFDIRKALVDEPIVQLGAIERPNDGINGVAMTKMAGDDGGYIVAGVNGHALTIYRSAGPSLLSPGPVTFTQVFEDPNFPDSGAGLALITQVDGRIFLVSMNADDSGANSLIGLYSVDLDNNAICPVLPQKAMPIPGMSDSLTLLLGYIATIPLIGRDLSKLLAPLANIFNSSFRWGKGLSITSADSFEIYATDRNVLPISKIPVIGSAKDFSVVVWTSTTVVIP
jgi:hypothetical protein